MKKLQFLHNQKKKILAVNGSHRNGNTQFALTKMIDLLNKDSSSTQGILVNLYERKINYATEADYDLKNTKKEIQDDMPLKYSLLQSADILILGSPIYFYSVTGRMKTFIDRFNIYYWDNKLKNKPVFTITVGGSTQPTQMINSLNKFYLELSMKNLGYQHFKAQHADELSKNQQAMIKLQQRAKQIASL